MDDFKDFNLKAPLANALDDLGFSRPTPIQKESFSPILSGRNVVGIAQTGTGKTLAYMLPLLRELRYHESPHPRILVIVPTRELVLQLVEQIGLFAKYLDLRVVGVYGGTNIQTQKLSLVNGVDILVATPGRLYDLALTAALQLKGVKKLVIDEVDVMLDLGFRFQLTNIFDLLPEKRQNIMFSATMTEDIADIIEEFFIAPQVISIAVSGTRLENINQVTYPVHNFYTKVNLLSHLLENKELFTKVLVFAPSKKGADRIFERLEPVFGEELGVIHSNKTQNHRIRSIRQFDEGVNRILIATDIMARGLDLTDISHVINVDVPTFPENYMHRIGRTGRAESIGNAILLYTEKEKEAKERIEALMSYQIPELAFPEEVPINHELTPEERSSKIKSKNHNRNEGKDLSGPAFHEKKEKNRKVNLGGSYRRELKKKYKKPKTKGDKHRNRRK